MNGCLHAVAGFETLGCFQRRYYAMNSYQAKPSSTVSLDGSSIYVPAVDIHLGESVATTSRWLLSLADESLLQYTSTSPDHEGSDYAQGKSTEWLAILYLLARQSC